MSFEINIDKDKNHFTNRKVICINVVMEADFWIKRWEGGQIAFHENEINAHLQNFWPKLDLPKGSQILVPLCGKTNDLLWLLKEGYKVLGVEISEIAVRDFFEENNLKPVIKGSTWCYNDDLKIICGNLFDLEESDFNKIDGVYDRASLIALPTQMRFMYAQLINKIIDSDSKILLVTFEYNQSEMNGPPFSVTKDEVLELYMADFDIKEVYYSEILKRNPQFKARGLTALTERVFEMQRR